MRISGALCDEPIPLKLTNALAQGSSPARTRSRILSSNALLTPTPGWMSDTVAVAVRLSVTFGKKVVSLASTLALTSADAVFAQAGLNMLDASTMTNMMVVIALW